MHVLYLWLKYMDKKTWIIIREFTVYINIFFVVVVDILI